MSNQHEAGVDLNKLDEQLKKLAKQKASSLIKRKIKQINKPKQSQEIKTR